LTQKIVIYNKISGDLLLIGDRGECETPDYTSYLHSSHKQDLQSMSIDYWKKSERKKERKKEAERKNI
jgi:hypothetical protein